MSMSGTKRSNDARRRDLAALFSVSGVLPVWLIVVLSSVVCTQTRARADEAGLSADPVRVRRWRVESGLPLSQIPLIAQTGDGYLWLGARNEGLIRFDGTRFSASGGELAPAWTFPGGKALTALFSCRDGGLCVGTRDGLWRLSNGYWTHITTAQGLSNNIITTIHEGPNHDLWVGTRDGLNRIRGLHVRVYQPEDRPTFGPIRAVCCDRLGVVWVGTSSGHLYRLVGDQLTMIQAPTIDADDEINAILEVRDGSLWIGKWNGGLTRWKAGATQIIGPAQGLNQTEIFALAEDRWGSIWIGTRKGLLVLPSPAAGGGKAAEIMRGATFSLLRDREGTIWSGTSTGLDQYKDWRLRAFSEEDGLPERNVSSTFPARGGGVWVGTNGGGLALFRDGKIVSTYGVAAGLRSNDVTSVCEARDGTVWVGSWGEGLYRLKDNKFAQVDVGDHLSTGVVRSIYEDHAGDIWVGTWGNGLLRLHGEHLTEYTRRDGLVDDQVRVIEEDSAGNLWIATQNGLNRFHDGQFSTYTVANGLSENSIFALRADDQGSLWIGTFGGGLNRLRSGRVTSYTTREGLPCDTICEILDDGQGNLWMSSVKGIFRVHKAEFDALDRGAARTISSSSYDRDDGMLSAQCNRGTQPSGCRTADGHLWFATVNGIVTVDPTALPANPVAPRPMLEQVLCDRVPVALQKSITLPAAQREVELRFAAICLLAAEKVRFRYKLEGYNADWIEAGHRREVHYPNLPPSSYKFMVSACNGDGVWGPVTELLTLTITPPFYQTASFQSMCAFMMLAAAGAAYRLRTATLRARERELVVLVDRRTTEARAAQAAAEGANRAKDRFLAVLSHELRTPLTPVLLAVDCLLNDEHTADAHEQLEMIRRNVELEARLVDDLLDVSRIECDRFKLDLELVDVHKAIAQAIEVCSAEIKKSGLKIEQELRAESHHTRADQARLIQIFWNLIRNAVKFISPGGTLLITTRDFMDDHASNRDLRLVVEFQDTGIGIDPDMLEKIFEPFEQGSVPLHERRGGLGLGLAISRAVAQAHGGSLTAASAGHNQGSTFRLELSAAPAPCTNGGLMPRPESKRPRPARLKILLVEDNADALRYLGVVLKRQGHQVTPASSLTLAREAARTSEFDLLVSDIELSDGTGLELIRELKPHGIIGIALSGYGSAEDVKSSLAAGFAMHLVKPVLAQVLDDAICRLANSPRAIPSGARLDYPEPLTESAVNDQSSRLSPISLDARS
jgi:signal transduction histidine kinase/ligand-binding sensor domain-containing protein/DNA-binding NarL/FixJ family response regulator